MSKAAVEVGIVDQPLPSDRGARLLEIDAHHDLEAVGKLFAQGGEALGVLDGCDGIVDRAGADDDQQAVVGAVQDGVDGVARRHHHPRRGQVRGISPITSCGVLSSFSSLIRRSSVVLNTAMAPVRWEPAGQ